MNFEIKLSFLFEKFMVFRFTRTQIWSYQDILWRSTLWLITHLLIFL